MVPNANFSHLQPCSALVVPYIYPKITSKAWRHSTRKALWHVLSWLCLRVWLPCFWACWVWPLGLACQEWTWFFVWSDRPLKGKRGWWWARPGAGNDSYTPVSSIHGFTCGRWGMFGTVAFDVELQVALPSCYAHLNIALYDVTFSQTS